MSDIKSIKLKDIKFDKIYSKADRFAGICPDGCSLCEDEENLLLLPYEKEHISGSANTELMFHKDCDGDYVERTEPPCPSLQKDGTCSIYSNRPFDCRSFPIVPKFSIDSSDVEFYFARQYCPIVNKLSSDFIRMTINCWRAIEKDLSVTWKVKYNELNEHNYIKTSRISGIK